MASEKTILRALDLLTVMPRGEIEMLAFDGPVHTRRLRRVIDSKNVVAVGISEKTTLGKPTGVLALTFYVDRKKPLHNLETHETVPPALPESITGNKAVPTDIIEIGLPRLEVRHLKMPLATRKTVQPGHSIGHIKVTAGTLGAIVERDGQYLLLSNSHVLANSGKARKGDIILYPGNADTGVEPEDIVAKLVDFVKFKIGFDYLNHADCAVALPLDNRFRDLNPEIKGLFVPRGVTKPVRGMKVTKVGRTTGKTTGRIKDVNFRLIIDYPGIGNVGFFDQVFCSRYTDGGDSGSLVIDKETGKAVGLHFAGFPDEHGVKGSVFNPIDKVLKSLNVKLVTKQIKLDD